MRTLNDIAGELVTFSALQTPGNGSGVSISHDDGVLREIIVNIVSGTATQVADLTVTVNLTQYNDAFEVPVTAASGSAVCIAKTKIPINKGDRFIVQVGTQGCGGTVPAYALPIIRR
jgi:hypothetical protein